MPATTKAFNDMILNRQRVGKLIRQPHRRGGSGGAKNHLHPARSSHLDAIRQPIHLKHSSAGLERVPGKFRHMNNLQTHGGDVVKVPLPLLARPLLGIVIGSNFHSGVSWFKVSWRILWYGRLVRNLACIIAVKLVTDTLGLNAKARRREEEKDSEFEMRFNH